MLKALVERGLNYGPVAAILYYHLPPYNCRLHAHTFLPTDFGFCAIVKPPQVSCGRARCAVGQRTGMDDS
jgi:hypothetical protein